MRLMQFLVCTVTAQLVGCQTAPMHPSLRAPSQGTASGSFAAVTQSILPALVPVRAYVAPLDDKGAYKLSPDGEKLMWVGRRGLGPGLFVQNLQSGKVNAYAVPTSAQWAQDSQHVLYHLHNGDENSRVYQLNTAEENASAKDLTPLPGVKAYLHSVIRGSRDLLIASNQRDPKVFDLFRHVHATGKLELLAQNPGTVGAWFTSPKGELLGRARKEGERWVYETPKSNTDGAQSLAWIEAFVVGYFDTLNLLRVSEDLSFAWALSNRGRDKLALVKVDVRSGQEEVVYADPRVDLAGVVFGESSAAPLAVFLDPDQQEWKFFDPILQAAVHSAAGDIEMGATRRIHIESLSDAQDRLVVSVSHAAGGETFLVRRNNVRADNGSPHSKPLEIERLSVHSRSLVHAQSPLPRQMPIRFQSRDGLTLNGYLTMPVLADGSTITHAMPTVVYVHGGPWARDVSLGGDPMPYFLGNRGYAVLQVNYRGSSGYGRAFMEAGKGEFAGKMHTDLLDGVDHLVAKGIADPNKVAIMGASYGGYASMLGMTHSPGRFACAISLVGMSDLARLIEDAPPYWDLGKTGWLTYAGDPANAAQREILNSKSPLYKVDHVQGPMLLLHGARDVRVKIDQSTRMVDALRQAGKSVDFHAYPRAGHGLYRWPDQLSYFRKTEDFLARCLGGRSSGFDFFQLASWAL